MLLVLFSPVTLVVSCRQAALQQLCKKCVCRQLRFLTTLSDINIVASVREELNVSTWNSHNDAERDNPRTQRENSPRST